MAKYQDVKLGDLFQISSGGTPSRKHNEYYDNGNIPWVKTGDLKHKCLYEAGEFITEDGIKNSSARIYPVDTVLLAMYGATIGACSILKIPAATNQACAAFVKSEKVLPDYLYLYLTSKKQFFTEASVGGAQPNISATFLKEVKIPLPSLEEQKKIAEILDKASDLISLRKKQIEKLDLLVKSRFVEMFGDPISNSKHWDVLQLQDLVTSDCSISYGIVQTGDEQKEGIPVFRPIDIVNNKLPILSVLKKTTEEISNKYKRTILQGNELLMTVRANIGDVCIIDETFKGCNVGRGIVPIRVQKDKVNMFFLKHQIQNSEFQKKLRALAKGIALIQLNMEDLRELKMIVPPLNLQNQFADFVQQVDKQKSEMQVGLEKLELNYKALMQKYFGE